MTIRVYVDRDTNDYVAYCTKYPTIIGVGDSKQRAIDDFKIILREYLDYLKEFKRNEIH